MKNVIWRYGLTLEFHLCTCYIPADSAQSCIVLLHLHPTPHHHTGLPSYTLLIQWNHKSQMEFNDTSRSVLVQGVFVISYGLNGIRLDSTTCIVCTDSHSNQILAKHLLSVVLCNNSFNIVIIRTHATSCFYTINSDIWGISITGKQLKALCASIKDSLFIHTSEWNTV